ncbi:and other transporter-domain-containing protein [Pseudomassariella vexata]|uniref:And other transporter-domain-containing protein n=1 Tax=Pseudomassariella vexata TaxID=1141098 RepID=A0A1Y2DXX1_9PEZI|nr:and other transporter-domain-containing protein [Pseudomassariella vexata]ORY63954.1 and other transporter-domain-containing protein [Pseudomassariella vexata]
MADKDTVEPAPTNSPPGYDTAPFAEKGRRESKAEYIAEINQNINAKISNPLAGIPRHELVAQIDRLCDEKGLQDHRHLMRKGALVAQDPNNYEDISGEEALDEAEIDALRQEVLHKWRVPKLLYLTIITCSIGAAVQGWDQEGSNGANLTFPKQFGIGTTSDHDTFLVGLINSAPYVGSAFIGCWCSDPLNNYLGRRGTIFLSAIFCLLTPIGSAVTQNWQQFFITRLLLGVGMGIKASTVPIFAAENSPASIRGALVMTWQMWTAFGIFLGVCANLAVGRVGYIAWRLQVGSAFIPAIPLTVLIFFCPESPRWYMKKNRYPEALRSLIRLRNNPIQAARDLNAIHAQLEIEIEAIGESTYLSRFIELFTIPRVRRATLASFVVMIAQQMCGINIIVFYSSTVFRESGTDDFGALLASFGFGLVNFVFAWPAIWTIDTFGRRSLLLFTFPNMAWTLLAAGLCTLIPGEKGAHLVLVALFVYLFGAFYSPGEGPVPFTYSAEVFPLSHREVGMAWAVATCLFWAAVLSITFPKILTSLGVIGAFCLYAGFNVVAFFMIFLWMPETKQRTLEELDYVFAVPTRTFITYNTTKAAPFWFKRYVLFQKGHTLEPLYHFDNPHHGSDTEAVVAKTTSEKNEYADAEAPGAETTPTQPGAGGATGGAVTGTQ